MHAGLLLTKGDIDFRCVKKCVTATVPKCIFKIAITLLPKCFLTMNNFGALLIQNCVRDGK